MSNSKAKFWTVKDGQIGTAHRNRDGQVVDFRPCGNVSRHGPAAILVLPEKGVVVEPLVLPATIREQGVLPEGHVRGSVSAKLHAQFEGVGVEVRISLELDLQTEIERAAAKAKALEEERYLASARATCRKNRAAIVALFERLVREVSPEDAQGVLSGVSIPKLKHANPKEVERLGVLVGKLVYAKVIREFPEVEVVHAKTGDFYSTLRASATLVAPLIEKLIEHDQRMREAKKAAYLASKSDNN